MTRERIRQVCDSVGRLLEGSRPFAPMLDRALDLVSKNLPRIANEIESLFVSEGITAKPFRLESLESVAKLLGRDVPYSLAKLGKQRTVLSAGSEYSADKILQVVRRAIEHWGTVTIEEVTVEAAEQS